jgi:hypothetical protein
MQRVAPFVVGFALLAAPAPAQFTPGDMYIACEPNHIQRVDPSTWSVSTFADSVDGLLYTGAVGFTPDGTSLLYCDWLADQVFSFDSSGNGTVIHDKSDGLVNPFGENGIAFAANDDLYVSDFGGNKIVLAEFGIAERTYAINKAAAQIARQVCETCSSPIARSTTCSASTRRATRPSSTRSPTIPSRSWSAKTATSSSPPSTTTRSTSTPAATRRSARSS